MEFLRKCLPDNNLDPAVSWFVDIISSWNERISFSMRGDPDVPLVHPTTDKIGGNRLCPPLGEFVVVFIAADGIGVADNADINRTPFLAGLENGWQAFEGLWL